MLATVTHILPVTYIRRGRMLPVAGRVEVRPGQKVSASDVIAQATVPAKHTLLDIRRGLGVSAQEAARCIVRKEGEHLMKGDVIAETEGLFRRLVRAPADGEIISITGSQVMMQMQTTNLDVKAGMAGFVAEVVPDRGAIIETSGALLQGAWGNGKIDSGMLMILAKLPTEELNRADLDVSLRGAVVLAGHCSSKDALQAGQDLPLRGLILSSMASTLVPTARSLNYPIIVIEGFGKIPMNESALRLLVSSEKRDTSVNASFNLRTGERPEIVIPLPTSGEAAKETDTFAPDQTVRVTGEPYQGKIGTLVRIRPGISVLPNGIKALAADVQLDQENRVIVPLANLEVIE